jgi:predicted transposase/invertase (TIGR01784 family)
MVLWLRYLTELKGSDKDTVPAEFFDNEDIRDAVKCLETSSYTKAELDLYDLVQDAICTHISVMDDAKNEGLAEGRAEGFEKGIEKGIERGRAEAIKKVAISMYKLQIPIAQIAEATGLSEVQILEIIK